MRDLIVKLEAIKDSKEWEKIVSELRDAQEEKNKELLDGAEKDYKPHSEAEMIRHEISFIESLIGAIKLKDKDVKEALVADLEKSMKWRVDRLLGKTHEYKLDTILDGEYYTWQDFIRAENWWIECFDNLPNKILEEEKVKEQAEQATSEAEIQEQIDALSSLEADGI